MPRSDSSNSQDSYGLTASQKSKAINIALNDPSIKSKSWIYLGKTQISNVSLTGLDGKTGYANFSDTVAQVPFQFGHGPFESERTVLYVDLNDGNVIGNAWYAWRGVPMDIEATIPPGAYWYYQLQPTIEVTDMYPNGTFSMGAHVYEIKPENTSIYPIVLDGVNLGCFLNGTHYDALVYYNDSTSETIVTNGSFPISQFWNAHISIPANMTPEGAIFDSDMIPTAYYVLLRNGEKTNVTIHFASYPL